jgi:hypothetical protein
MANDQRLGSIWKGRAWDDGEHVPRIQLADSSYAEVFASIGYAWNGSAFQQVTTSFATGQAAGTTGLLFAVIDTNSSGDNTIVAADATRKIKVVSYVMVASAAVAVRWKSGAGTSLSGTMAFAANGGVISPGNTASHLFETAVNTNLVLNLGAAQQVSGHMSYFLQV